MLLECQRVVLPECVQTAAFVSAGNKPSKTDNNTVLRQGDCHCRAA